MAICVPSSTTITANTISTLISDYHSHPFICSAAATTNSSSSSPPSLRLHFPRHLRIGPTAAAAAAAASLRLRPRSRRLTHVVQAKQQTFSNFDELISKSDKPVLVDFYAVWCGPCQLMVPILEKVSAALKDKVQVVKIDTEKYTSLADKYKIEALPTFILFKDGEPCDRFEGALPAEKVIERVETALAVKK